MIRYLSVILGITFLSASLPSYAIYRAFDERSLLRYPDEFKCVPEIMGISGLQKLHFGTWMKTAQNLKTLVDRYVAPPPTYKKDTFPPHQWNNE